jgi:hypothetical protein
MSVWDQMEDGSVKGPQKPFWALNFEDEKEVLEWLNAEMDALQDQARERVENQRKNLAVYRGIQYQSQDTRTRDESAQENSPKKSRSPRVIYNHMVDMVEQDVSRITKYRGAIECVPPSEDYEDRIVAKVGEDLVESFWGKSDIDNLAQKLRRRTRIFGDDYIFVGWNRNAGPYDMDWLCAAFKKAGCTEDPRKLSRAEIRRVFREKIGEWPKLELPVKGEDGKPLAIDRPMRRGDITHRLVFSWDMLLQRQPDYEMVDYGAFKERVKTDTLRAMHPTKADKLKDEGAGTAFDIETLEERELHGEAVVFHFYHRSTDMLDQGRYIKFTRDAILINRVNPYVGWDDRAILPWVRSVDIDTPGVLNGDATVTHGRGPQAVYNNLVSLRVRNRFLFSHPKWFYPQNSVTKESLGNTTTMVSYKGPVPPSLSQPALAETNEAQMMQEAKGDLQQIMGVYGVSRGDPPTGVTAAVALTFLDEQESERANVGVQTHTRVLKQIALMDLWLMADYYDEERLKDLLGKTRAEQVKTFKMANLRSVADLNIRNMTALPQQKSARTQSILSDEVLIDTLDLGEDQRLRNMATVAIRKAEDENGGFLNGAEVPDPLDHEYHLSHYRAHLRAMNEPSYGRMPKPNQTAWQDHVMAHEMFLYDQCVKFPPYQALVLQEFPGFPIFFKPEAMGMAPLPPPTMPGPPGGMPQPPMAPMPQLDPGMAPGAGMEAAPPEPMAPGMNLDMPQGA